MEVKILNLNDYANRNELKMNILQVNVNYLV